MVTNNPLHPTSTAEAELDRPPPIHPPHSHHPFCPRCGYDLSGAVAAWKDSCELVGTCPECGLGYDWADVLRPERMLLPGFVEHALPRGAEGRRWYLRRAVRTWLWTIWPMAFHRRVQLHHRINLARMFAWLPVMCVLMVLLGAAAEAMNVAVYYWLPGRSWKVFMEGLGTFVNSASLGMAVYRPGYWYWVGFRGMGFGLPVYFWAVVAFCALVPLLLLAMPETRLRAQVRTVHVLRASIFGMSWLVAGLAIRVCTRIAVLLVSLVERLATGGVTGGGPGRAAIGLPWWFGWAFGGAVAIWLTAWWWLVISRGLKLEQPRRVFAVVFGGSAFVAALVLLFDRRMLQYLI